MQDYTMILFISNDTEFSSGNYKASIYYMPLYVYIKKNQQLPTPELCKSIPYIPFGPILYQFKGNYYHQMKFLKFHVFQQIEPLQNPKKARNIRPIIQKQNQEAKKVMLIERNGNIPRWRKVQRIQE